MSYWISAAIVVFASSLSDKPFEDEYAYEFRLCLPLISPLSLEHLFGGVAPDFQVVFQLLEPLHLCPELFFAPAFRLIFLVIQRINLTVQRLFFGVPFVVEFVECGVASMLERIVIGT